MHLKEHTYKTLKFKCEHCKFLFNDILSLDVNLGRKDLGSFECGICGFELKSEDNLNIHFHTCETFTCDYCFNPRITGKNLSDLINHLKNKQTKHLKKTQLKHTKMDINDIDRVSQRRVSSSYLMKDIN